MTMYNTIEIMDAGLSCLVEKLGIVGAEQFISVIKRENFDYTAWQRSYFDEMDDGEFMTAAAEYAENHPHRGKGQRI
ncbi:MAG TPA: hypothetical protein IAA61_04425 [Candidatus Ornithomonoglobus merdipullorum]|uniref:Uncharacterized protein n=1 Tax=Candidatus Ornithomonoglobus merdipullorum TaxID=2840895 RepID=A0A9D1MBC1_9FIRM|nr:hypothetical protein [Candidatus Ornithomonoglobus merdipullorum]